MKRPGLITVVALVIVSALAASPLFFNAGFLNTRGGGDSPFLLFRLQQLYTALGQGVFPVRWMPDAAYGLGYPFFSYYAALPLYIAAFFKFLGASFVFALKLTQLGGFILAALAMYGWLRAVGLNRGSSTIAALVYTFAPFHLVNIYVRGDSLNEFWAFALYPLCLWAAHNLSRRYATDTLLSPYRRALLLALPYAALILTHNISALIFSPFLVLYCLTLSLRKPKPESADSTLANTFDLPHCLFVLVHSAVAIVFGFALSAFFWLPAIRETDSVQLGPVTQGYFNYSNHFRTLNLIQPSAFFNFDVGSAASTPFAMGLAQALLTLLAVVILLVLGVLALRRTQNHFASFSAQALFGVALILSLLIATFMITPLSRVLWDHLPLLPFVQFPWRFLSVQSLFASALIGLAAQALLNTQYQTLNKLGQLAFILLSIVYSVLSILSLRPDFIPLTDADVTAERLQTYEYFSGNLGTTINYEYLPKWVYPRPYSSEEFIFGAENVHAKALTGDATGMRTAKKAASQTWQISVSSSSASVAVPLLYWPGWTATLNGQPLPIYPAENGLGWVAFDLPSGQHTVELRLGDTDLRRNAQLVSLLAILIALLLAQPWLLIAPIAASPRRFGWGALAIVLAVAGIGVIGRVLNAQAQPIGAASMDFDQQAYLYSSVIPFGNGDILQGYNYSSETLHPGDLLAVAFQWQADHQAAFNLDLVSPAELLLHYPATFATITGNAQGSITTSLSIPTDLPSGVYLLRLSLIQNGNLLAPAFTFNGQPRGALYLKPIHIIAAQPTGASNIQALTSAVALGPVSATQPDSTAVDITLPWLATQPIPANYALSLRLHDGTGVELAALDTQPTGGVYPMSAWPLNTLIPDHYHFGLPSGLPPGDYPLTVTLYDSATLAPVGALTTPIHLSQWTPPPGVTPLRRLTDTLFLQDVALPASVPAGDRLSFTARWTSLAAQTTDLSARWSIVGENGNIEALEDQALTGIPSSQWAAGALVLGRPTIKIPLSAQPGSYTVNAQLIGSDGKVFSPAMTVGQIAITPSDRTTILPPMQFLSDATFGDIRLAGYDTALTPETLTLTLHYQALKTTPTDYKYFVHLFNPADETIVAQADGFPDFPTSQWEKQEVINITVTLPLADLEPNTVYNLGVGWYDPATGDRLGDRVVLSQGVVRP